MNGIALRPAAPADAAFVYRVAETTVRAHVESAGKKWAAERMRAKCEQDAADAQTRIVVVDGADAGFLKVESRPDEIVIDALLLLPEHQRSGIGSGLLASVLRESAARQVPVRLFVYHANPARSFWERHGFAVIGEDNDHWQMQRHPR
jgi:ribosomal protein S18 acetylase RimI-like enzyme